jgi:hypothetical protein
MGYGLNGRGSIPGSGKILLSSTVSKLLLGLTQPPIQWVPQAISPGVKRTVSEAGHSPPSGAKVKDGGLYLHYLMA